MSRAGRSSGIVALFAALAGCSGGVNPNAPATLTGRVTYNNAPVTGGTLFFHIGENMTSVNIENDGSYRAPDLPLGDIIVTVDTEMHNPAKKVQKYTGVGGAGRDKKTEEYKVPEGVGAAPTFNYVKIPPKYTDKTKSDLKVTVAAGKQVKNFELKDN